MANMPDNGYSQKTDSAYHKGQIIYYKGDEAKILDVKPVLTIKISGKSHVICGNTLSNDVCLK